jgi:hypothetical protein
MAFRGIAVIAAGWINVGCLGSKPAQIRIGAVKREPAAQNSKDPIERAVRVMEVDPGAVKFAP